jgi:hypothetical protein
MTCPDCHGACYRPVWVVVNGRRLRQLRPCGTCQAWGIASCCEGAVGCADDVTNEGTDRT